MTADVNSPRLFVRENGALLMTPLRVAIVALELSDILFAIDSVARRAFCYAPRISRL